MAIDRESQRANASMATMTRHRHRRLLFLPCLLLLLVILLSCSLCQSASSPPSITPSSGLILVLGSDGLIGSALTAWLHESGFSTVVVHNRSHVDLRLPEALPAFLSASNVAASNIAFAFFLACEVGGSKFLLSSSPETRRSIITHNLALYAAVLPFLSSHRIPFLFTSSYLSHSDTPYGAVKRIGEQYLSTLPLARTVRLYNVYGRERTGAKAHVMTDFVTACSEQGLIHSRTDGSEWRQFLHAQDAAAALGDMMRHWPQLEAVTELSSGQWLQMRQIGQLVANISAESRAQGGTGRPCHVLWGQAGEEVGRLRRDPNVSSWWWRETRWLPAVSVEDGVRDLYRFYGRQAEMAVDSEVRLMEAVMAARWSQPDNASVAFTYYPTSSAPPFRARAASHSG